MKIVSFNINGLRARYHQIEAIKYILNPDIIGLQETKVHDLYFPVKEISNLNYKVYFYGKKQYDGVAFLCIKKPIKIRKGINIDYTEFRIIIADYFTSSGKLTIINCYAPNGDNIFNKIKFNEKKKFYKNLTKFINYNYNCNNSLILIMGDMNIAPTDLDIGIGNKKYKNWLNIGKCGFLKEERKFINNLFKLGFVDSYRYDINSKNKKNFFSWFDYRFNSFNKNYGLRIDLFLASLPLSKLINKTGIDYNIRSMVKPSDHAPVWVDFNLDLI